MRRLLATVSAFDAQLRAGFTDEEITVLSGMLGRLRHNVAEQATSKATW
ncbi:MAG: hypothetical protein ABR592_00755 [Nitriliruptorales bacterium]